MSKKKEKHLGQITDKIIEGWENQYDKRDDGDFCCNCGGLLPPDRRGYQYYCVKCGSLIKKTLCYVSLHLKVFEPNCAGSGKVLKINFPYCPNCDGDLEYVTACYHV